MTTRQYKVVLLGDSGVGKTNLITQFVKGEFIEAQESTIGVAFFSHSIQLQDGPCIRLELWDTAGQERYAGLAPLYYRGAHVAIIVYDITQPRTLDRAKLWVKELEQQSDLSLCIALAGNKVDIEDQRKVSEKEALQYANDHHLLFLETSAKTGKNIKELFVKIAQILSTAPPPVKKEDKLRVGTDQAAPDQGSCYSKC